MLFHQASCSSVSGVENSPLAVFTVSLSPPTLPICTAGTPMSLARSTTFTASSALQLMITRDSISVILTSRRHRHGQVAADGTRQKLLDFIVAGDGFLSPRLRGAPDGIGGRPPAR